MKMGQGKPLGCLNKGISEIEVMKAGTCMVAMVLYVE